MNRRKRYERLSINRIILELESPVMVGSVIDPKIKVQQIEVTPYEDGFDFEGVEESDFTITFE